MGKIQIFMLWAGTTAGIFSSVKPVSQGEVIADPIHLDSIGKESREIVPVFKIQEVQIYDDETTFPGMYLPASVGNWGDY